MKFINNSDNTVYLADIDKYVSPNDRKPQEITLDETKKSSLFRAYLRLKKFIITECGDSLFERNLLRLQNDLVLKAGSDTHHEEKTFPDPSGDLEIMFRGTFFDAGGYSKTNRNLVMGLARNKVKIGIYPDSTSHNNLNELEMRKMSSLTRQYSKNAIYIQSVIPSFAIPSKDYKYNILYTTLESSSMPQQFVDSINAFDEIWTTSEFCKNVILNHCPSKKVIVIPNSIDVSLYNDKWEPSIFNPTLKGFTFVSVFTWNYRKGYDALLRAYLEEFDANDPVSLLLITRPMTSSVSDYNMIQKEIIEFQNKYGGEKAAHIARCSNVIAEYRMPRIYKACKAFVSFSRGEGFGLPYIEASMSGIPVIATNYSGQTMFLNYSNSVLVDVDSLKKSDGKTNIHYWDGQYFPDLTSEAFNSDARKALRYVYENYTEVSAKNLRLRKHISENYKIDVVAGLALRRLNDIWRKLW